MGCFDIFLLPLKGELPGISAIPKHMATQIIQHVTDGYWLLSVCLQVVGGCHWGFFFYSGTLNPKALV